MNFVDHNSGNVLDALSVFVAVVAHRATAHNPVVPPTVAPVPPPIAAPTVAQIGMESPNVKSAAGTPTAAPTTPPPTAPVAPPTVPNAAAPPVAPAAITCTCGSPAISFARLLMADALVEARVVKSPT